MKKSVLALLAVAGLAAVANAQVDGQAGFSFAVPTAPGPNPPFGPSPSGTTPDADGIGDATGAPLGLATVQLLVGGFGGTHLGLLSWVGSISMVDPIGGTTLVNTGPGGVGLRNPYVFGNIQGVNNGTSITGIDANRSAFQDNLLWEFGQPMPQPALYAAIDAWDDVYRVHLNMTDTTTPRDIVVTATGVATFVTSWGITAQAEPEDGTPGFVSYAVNGITTDVADGTFIVRIIPAPGAAALLGLGGLVAARRRRA